MLQCEHPIWIIDPSDPWSMDDSGRTFLNRIKVGCGKCAVCQSNHRKMWFFRLKVESDKCVCSYCVTLTYNDSVLPESIVSDSGISYHPIDYSDIQRFNKRLRKIVGSFRFFCIGEYGKEENRPHFHICFFFNRPYDKVCFEDAVFKCWFPDCRITIDTTNDKACNYILKYCLSFIDPDYPKEFTPLLRCSTKPYIGYGLLDNKEFVSWLHSQKTDISSYVGYKSRLPRIYRDKVFSDEEKAFIAQELGRVQRQKIDVESANFYRLISKYGLLKASEYLTFESSVFRDHIKKLSKLKSL